MLTPNTGRHEAEPERADIASIYRHAVRQDLTTRNPVIVIPGIMGSRLVGALASRQIWGDFRTDPINPATPEDFRVIGLPVKMGVPLDQLHSTSQTAGSLAEVKGKFAGIPIRKRIYGNVLGAMGVSGYADATIGRRRDMPAYQGEGSATAFEFDYDWRRSLDESAIRFHRFIRQTTRFLQAQRGSDRRIRFDVVAHSMGGLLLRYYLQYGGQLLPYDESPRPTWEGAQFVENVIIVGTPNAGSLFALGRLVSGLGRNPVHPAYPATLLGSMPSIYQLLPRSRHRPLRIVGEEDAPDLLDPDLWRRMGWGLAAPDRDDDLAMLIPEAATAAERRDIALDHLSKCLAAARSLHRALDTLPPRQPRHLRMHLFAGDSVLTPLLAAATPGERRLRYEQRAPGDGTVLRTSALLDERVGADWVPRVHTPIKWDSVMFVPGDHMGITHHPVTINNILYLLLAQPRG
ncbi:MAG: hypothetical protein QNJ94_20065 [Alphaproteobacteria bacterium]|nr:hypothetical protein [Alphaproteobacteria bacterium]